jgi:hypothetical protein
MPEGKRVCFSPFKREIERGMELYKMVKKFFGN